MARLVILETPYRGNNYEDLEENIKYARECMADCLRRGESPLAFHLLYTQEGILDDKNPNERKLGITAASEWTKHADVTVVYTDRGMSEGMKAGIELAKKEGRQVEYRSLKKQGN